ncbi:MAG: anaerobic ribonucleoside-triphosphate reductase, partial [Bacillota bacterium]
GDFHIHDLGNLSVYCCGWDLQDLLLKGFRGVKSKVESKPPKHFKAALGQIVNFFYTLQGEASGAQAFSNFDTYLAPFIRYDDLSYKEVKQAIQEFMFNINVPTRVGFQCLSEDTEILTPSGWKKYHELDQGDIIKTFNVEKGFIENKEIKKIFRRKYKGKMFNIKNRIQDQLISPGHRMVRRIFSSQNYKLEEVEDVNKFKSPQIIPIAADNNIKEIDLNDEEIKLIAWIISEGSLESKGNWKRITIYQSKNKNKEKYNEIISLLKLLNFEFNTQEGAKSLGDTVTQIRFNAETSRSLLGFFDNDKDIKSIPKQLLEMSQRQSRLFLETYIKGDGHEGCKITVSSKNILHQLQQIIVNSGYGFTVSERQSSGVGKKLLYIIRVIRHQDTYISNIKEVDYKGVIWSVNSENETVIAKRNGKVFITGNTPFTNITMDLEVPKFMKDDPVIIGGEFKGESYKEFQEEMDLLNRAFAEVMISGDAKGRMFSFPIPTYNITEDFEWDNPVLDPVWEMTAKYGIPYFCLNENTNVITNNGIKQLKNIDINKDKILGDDGNFCNIKKIFNSNHKEYIKITTEKDQIIECSLNHRFPIRNGLKKAINLSMSDELREYNKEIIFENGFRLNYKNYKYFNVYNKFDEKIFFESINNENIDEFYYLKVCDREIKTADEFNYISSRFQTTLKDIKIPEKLDEDIFEIIGQLLGDGYLPKTKNTIRLTSNDHEIIDFFTKTIEEKFELNTYITKAGVSKTCLDVNVNSKMLKEYLKHVGLKFGRGNEKEIPQIIYERNDKEIGALLRGLFDTDGSISLNNSNNPIITLTLKNRKLLQQVLELLMFLGIAAYYKSSRKKYGEIRIHGEKNIKLFKDKIGFSIKRKSERLIIKNSNKPNLGDKIVTKKQSLKKFGNDHRQRKKKDVFRIKRNAEGIYLFVDKIIEQNNYIKIKSLKRIKNKLKTVDIKVDSENHLFTLENNIIVHNSNFVNSDMNPEDARSMCLHPEEKILIKENNKISKYTMKELFKKYKDKKIDDEWYHVSSKIKALSLNPETGKVEWVDISKLLEIKDNRLITITAKDGKTMKVSADHLVAVYSEKGITTKKASQVNKDDFLLVLQDASDVLNNENIEVTNDLAWFMGLFMADGNYLYDSRYDRKVFRGVQITFNKQDKELINKTKDFIKKHLNYDMKFILDPRYDNSLRGYIYNSNFAKNLSHNFNLKKYHELPEWIWSASSDKISSFIKGFFDGDGYELGKEIHINDQALAIELNFLFQLVGISTTLNFKDNSQVIRIQHVLGRGANNNKVIRDKLHNLIPQYLLDPKFVKDKNGNNLYQSYGCKMVGLSTIDRWKISNKKIEFLRNSDFAVTEVKKIKREKLNYQQLFYDIELEKNHYFVHSDGNITHNCCR